MSLARFRRFDAARRKTLRGRSWKIPLKAEQLVRFCPLRKTNQLSLICRGESEPLQM